jgi:cellulose synthase/poly-beta-1,6-N-acetylglucosamine synthase-like glycosyltransferase
MVTKPLTAVSENDASFVPTPHFGITAIVPARDEELVIEACVRALQLQPEIGEILVGNDQSRDRTRDLVQQLAAGDHRIRLLETQGPPAGWVGKNNAVWLAAREAKGEWLLFTDADAQLLPGAAAKALQIARDHDAAMVSFSPEQVTREWYEKALIPFVYLRLARRFSFAAVNDPLSPAAASNGQFLMIRRDAYEAIGGHASVASEVLEDVALAKRVKAAGYRIWFGSGKGVVRTRMYRSFDAMWEGWRKNLYPLMGGTSGLWRELLTAVPWIAVILLLLGVKFPFALLAGLGLLLARHASYAGALASNGYPAKFILYYMPGATLYAGVLVASYLAHVQGKVSWKGRAVVVRTPGAAK